MQSHLRMKKRIFFLAMMTLVLLPVSVHADGVSFKTARGNFYSAGGNANVTENAPGDIVVAGGNVFITGNAGEDVLAAGGTVYLSGKAGDDIRIAGGNIVIDSEIGGEAVLAGGDVKLLPRTNIKNDLFAAAGTISIEGNIGGGARIKGDNVIINGTINEDVEVISRRLTIGRNTVIKGTLSYEAAQEARIEQGAVIKGQKIFALKHHAPLEKKVLRLLWVWWVVKFLATTTAALVIYFVLRRKTEELTALALDQFGNELLIGFILLIVIPAAIIILFITLVGWLLGLMGLFFYVALVTLSTVLGAVVFSGMTGKYIFKKKPSLTWPVILLGVFIYHSVGMIPILGWFIKFVFFLSALGAVSHLFYMSFKNKFSQGSAV